MQRFLALTSEAPGSLASSCKNVLKLLEEKCNREISELSLGRPISMGSYICIGTDAPNRRDNFVVCMSADALYSGNKDPLKSFVELGEHVRDLCRIDDGCFLATTGEGVLQVFSLSANGSIAAEQQWETAHTKWLREINCRQCEPFWVVSGGFDCQLCVTDVTTAHGLYSVKMKDVISSAKWTPEGNCVWCTLDNGEAFFFDFRSKFSPPTIELNTFKKNLFAHAQFDNSLLVGFDDREMKLFDVRRLNSVVDSAHDPFVDAIGIIDYDHSSAAFVVSGYTDFSVWKSTSDGFRIWAHGDAGLERLTNDSGMTTSAGFHSHDAVVCNSHGEVSIHVLGF